MKTISIVLGLCVFLLSLPSLFSDDGVTIAQQLPGDENWSEGFHLPGVYGGISHLLVWGDTLVARGGFTDFCGVKANSLALWDGSEWRGLDPGEGFDHATVGTPAIYNGRLCVGGMYWDSAMTEIYGVRILGNSGWENLPPLYTPGNTAMIEYHNQLFVGGGAWLAPDWQNMSALVSWDGVSWNPINDGHKWSGTGVTCLTVFQDTLYIGGYFDFGMGSTMLATWDGSTLRKIWGPTMGPDALGEGVSCMLVHEGKLYLGGEFTAIGAIPANHFAVYDGNDWTGFGDANAPVPSSMGFLDGELYCTSAVLVRDSTAARYVCRWDGSTWLPLADCPNSVTYMLAAFDSKLYVGGCYATIGNVAASSIATFDGEQWKAVCTGNGLASIVPWIAGAPVYVRAMERYHDDLVVGGVFETAGNAVVNNIAAWDGSDWRPLAGGISGVVRSLAIHDGKLVVGGYIEKAGEIPVHGIATWDGTRWDSLGHGLHGSVEALGVYNGELIAGGPFDSSGTQEIACVARWDGVAWQPMGQEIYWNGPSCFGILGGILYAGGSFFGYGVGPTDFAYWDGQAWRDPTGYPGNSVSALLEYNSKLVVSGPFTSVYDSAYHHVHNIAFWDGQSWDSLGSGLNDGSRDLAEWRGNLIAVGSFTKSGETILNRVARWDGRNWAGFGSGLDRQAMTVHNYGGRLYVGGLFAHAGGKPSYCIASWPKTPTTVDCGDVNADGTINLADAVYLLHYLFMNGSAPDPLESGDVNCDGRINIADVIYMVNYIFRAGFAPCAACE